MSARRPTVWRWLPAVAWMALIFVLSAQAGLRVSDDPGVDGPFRHVVHVVMYAILAVLLAYALGAARRPGLLVLVVLLTTAYGVTDEIHQSFVPLRNGNTFDVLLDLVGALIGVGIVAIWPRLIEGRTTRHV